jgi:hypothetical protein
LLDSISLCLNNKNEFTSDTIKETLKTLLSEPTPPLAFMRTAILSSNMYHDIKRFVLSDIIPNLVKRQVWLLNPPEVWNGVVYVSKNLDTVALKYCEPALKSFLGLVSVQLKILLKKAPNLKPLLAKLIKTLSVDELHDVTSGLTIIIIIFIICYNNNYYYL